MKSSSMLAIQSESSETSFSKLMRSNVGVRMRSCALTWSGGVAFLASISTVGPKAQLKKGRFLITFTQSKAEQTLA